MNPIPDAYLTNIKEAHENLAAHYLIWLRSAGDLSDATGFAAYMTTQPSDDLGRRLLDAHLRNADERSAHSAALGRYLISSLTVFGE
ncbi:hypothetical protein [Arvimicrobium flavum]|uniref:hypothetical protein n=1 Tax=Arvimicrobium flavum TaxID=3393320 RepID=UPI00237C2E89|nr:hypothetical protein [Mesorhizobium shangrilense]